MCRYTNVCCWGDGARLQRLRRVPSSAATSNPQLPLPPVHNGAGRRRRAAHGRYCCSSSSSSSHHHDHWVRGQFLLFWFQIRTATVFWESVLKVSFTPNHNFILLKRLNFETESRLCNSVSKYPRVYQHAWLHPQLNRHWMRFEKTATVVWPPPPFCVRV